MSALMTDLIAGTVSPQAANAACNAGGKLLRIVEMQGRYGQMSLLSVPKYQRQIEDAEV